LKRIYVAHPLRGLDQAHGSFVKENMKETEEICKQIVNADSYYDVPAGEWMPVSPLHAFSFLAGFDPERVMKYCFELLHSCDEMWVFGRWWESEGLLRELGFAAANHVVVKIFPGFYIDDVPVEIKDLAQLCDYFARCIYTTSLRLDSAKSAVTVELNDVERVAD